MGKDLYLVSSFGCRMKNVFKDIGRGMLLPDLYEYRVWLDAQIDLLSRHRQFLDDYLRNFKRKYKGKELIGVKLNKDLSEIEEVIRQFKKKKMFVERQIRFQKSNSRKNVGVYY